MKFGFFTDQDTTRYCYLRLRRLKLALKDPKVLDALVGALAVPDATDAQTAGQKMAAIERRIEHLRGTPTSLWHGVPAPEVLAASIFGAPALADGTAPSLFSHVARQTDLMRPVIHWLKGSGLTPRTELPLGNESLDVVGYRKGELLAGPHIIGLAVKNDLGALHHALNQMAVFQTYTHAMYLACTPALAAEYLAAQAAAANPPRWDGEALRRRLRESGFGLVLVEGDAVSQALPARERPLTKERLGELAALLREAERRSPPG